MPPLSARRAACLRSKPHLVDYNTTMALLALVLKMICPLALPRPPPHPLSRLRLVPCRPPPLPPHHHHQLQEAVCVWVVQQGDYEKVIACWIKSNRWFFFAFVFFSVFVSCFSFFVFYDDDDDDVQIHTSHTHTLTHPIPKKLAVLDVGRAFYRPAWYGGSVAFHFSKHVTHLLTRSCCKRREYGRYEWWWRWRGRWRGRGG